MLVACLHDEKDVVVNCLLWLLLSQQCVTILSCRSHISSRQQKWDHDNACKQHMELPRCNQALPKFPMRKFIIIALPCWIRLIHLWGRVGYGMCCFLDSTQTPTTVPRYNTQQNNYFISAYHYWQSTASQGSVRISFMDISMIPA